MRINTDVAELQAFCTLVETGAFNRAAERMALSNSAFSRRIARLEEAIGGRLFERDTRNLQLTALGRDLYQRVNPLLGDLAHSLTRSAELARGERGAISVACLTSVAYSLLPVAVSRFRAHHPNMQVDVWDGNAIPVREAVSERRVELGVGMWWEPSDDLCYQTLIDDPYVLACPADHPLANRSHIDWQEISHLRLTALRTSSGNRRQIDAALAARHISLNWFDAVESFSTLMGFIEHGNHLSILPRLSLAVARRMAIVPIQDPLITRRICLIRRHDQPLSVPGQALWDSLADTLLAAAPPSSNSHGDAAGTRQPA